MRKLTTLFIVMTLCGFTLSAQKITGTVKDGQGKTLDKTTVSLLRAKDSSVVKLSVTDNDGKFTFDAQPGQYLVSLSHVGYFPMYSKAIDLSSSSVTVDELNMTKSEGAIQGVTVSSKKPMVEVKADKMILNIEGTINAVGNDALELLRKAPGVLLDKDDNISLAGKNGVTFYIDGKKSPLAGTDLIAYLKSLQASQIEAIEIITNPSAKYDAAGNAGIINIRLKKNKSYGTNGSVNAGYNIGIHPKYNAGINLNNRQGRVNLFGSYNYNWNTSRNFMRLDRDVVDTAFRQRNQMFNKNTTHGFKAGMDWYINNKHTIGVMVNGNLTDGSMRSNSNTTISKGGVLDRTLIANNRASSDRDNLNGNINYRFIDTAGHELNIDLDYGNYSILSDQYQPNRYYDPSGNLIGENIRNMSAPTDIDIYTVKVDYEQNFKGGKLGYGLKSSYVDSKNDFKRFLGQPKSLETHNNFHYKENINAAYVNYNRQFKGFMIQLGVRVENTNVKGYTEVVEPGKADTSMSFKRNYSNPFPSAALTINKNPMSQWNFTYSRRIDRPAYQDLNPFEFRLDDYTYQRGNTLLRPQFTNSFGVTHTYKYVLNTSLNYSHVSDMFTQLVDTANKSRSFISKQNLATQDIVSLNVSYPFSYKSYSAFGNLNTYYSHYKANFGSAERNVNLDVFAFSIYMQHSIKFGKKKDWTGEVSGWYASPSIWGGTFKSKEMWSVDAGVSKTVLKGKGMLKASVSDIFQTMRWRGISDFAGQHTVASGGWESRQFKLNFSWRFGSNTVKAARQRKSGAEDESKRVGSQGGGISQ